MPDTMAFAVGSSASTFLARPSPTHQSVCVRPAGARMALPNPFANVKNPFAQKPAGKTKAASAFVAPQPGDPGYKEPKVEKKPEEPATPVPSAKDKPPAQDAKAPAKEAADPAIASKLPVIDSAARGLSLLREDLFKSAPEKVGVGRQDATVYYKPQYGEPGYKKKAYEEAYGSELEKVVELEDGASTDEKLEFVQQVKEAARELKKGKKASEVKAKMFNLKDKDAEPEFYDIPDYLKPIPEDTPRKGMSWKNYIGR